MAKFNKRLEAMRINPKADWTIGDVEALCRSCEIGFEPPNKGSHAKVSDPSQIEIVTVPFKRPIKPVYIRKLVEYVDAVLAHRAKAANLQDDATLAALHAIQDALKMRDKGD
jgi:hypothetical protein